MRSPLVLSCALLLLSAQASYASEPRSDGWFFGARTGWSKPLGSASNERDALSLGDTYAWALPLWLEAGYKLGPRVSVGAHAQLSPAFLDGCPPGMACSGDTLRAGLFATLHLPAMWSYQPWLGVLAGVEATGFGLAAEGQSVRLVHSGPEFVGLQVGADHWVSPRFMIGPYFAASMGMFTRIDARVDQGSGSEDIRARGVHGWLSVGVRGVLPFFEREAPPSGVNGAPQWVDTQAVRDYDAAVREQRAAAAMLQRGRTGLAQQKLRRVVMLAERALAGMDALLVAVRPSRYQSLHDGELSYEALAERLRGLRDGALQQLEALAPAAPPRGDASSAPAGGP